MNVVVKVRSVAEPSAVIVLGYLGFGSFLKSNVKLVRL
jgi:hypothetical protein